MLSPRPDRPPAPRLDRLRAVEGEGFPVTYDQDSSTQGGTCALCGELFFVDQRGVPILQHPELGAILVCYRCASDLASDRGA